MTLKTETAVTAVPRKTDVDGNMRIAVHHQLVHVLIALGSGADVQTRRKTIGAVRLCKHSPLKHLLGGHVAGLAVRHHFGKQFLRRLRRGIYRLHIVDDRAAVGKIKLRPP